MPKQSRRKGSNNSQTTKNSKAPSRRGTRRTSTTTENERSRQQTPVSTTVTTQHAVLPVPSSGPSDDSRTLTLSDISVIVQQVIKSLPQLQGQQAALSIQLAPTSVPPSEPVSTLAQETAPTTLTCSGPPQGLTPVTQGFMPVITDPHTTRPPG